MFSKQLSSECTLLSANSHSPLLWSAVLKSPWSFQLSGIKFMLGSLRDQRNTLPTWSEAIFSSAVTWTGLVGIERIVHSLSFLGISLTVNGVVSQVDSWERKPWSVGGYPSSGSWTHWGHIWFLTYRLGDLIEPPRVLSTQNKPNFVKHPLVCLMCRSHSNKSVAINFVKRNGRLIVLPHAYRNKIKKMNKKP